MSSPLVTFNFKTFPKHRQTQFFKFFGTNLRNVRLKTRGQRRFWKKKFKKWFFQFFLKEIILFLLEFELYVKNAFFWGIACWNGSKITKFGIFAHFSWFLSRFLFFTIFLMILRKKIFSLEFLFNLCSDITKTW